MFMFPHDNYFPKILIFFLSTIIFKVVYYLLSLIPRKIFKTQDINYIISAVPRVFLGILVYVPGPGL